MDDTKKTLVSSYEKLQCSADEIASLVGLSQQLVRKFERTEHICKNMTKPADKTDNVSTDYIPDIIDMFNGIDSKLKEYIDEIGRNLDKVINMID